MNPLEQNPTARRIAYQVFWVVSLVVGATQVGFASAGADTPTWLTVTLSVLPFVGAAIGYTAQANVKPTTMAETSPEDRGFVDGADTEYPARHARPEAGAYDTGGLLIALAAIVVIACGVVWLFQAL